MNISRRGLIVGIASLVAAPAIVRATTLMPIKAIKQVGIIVPEWTEEWIHPNGLIKLRWRIVDGAAADIGDLQWRPVDTELSESLGPSPLAAARQRPV